MTIVKTIEPSDCITLGYFVDQGSYRCRQVIEYVDTFYVIERFLCAFAVAGAHQDGSRADLKGSFYIALRITNDRLAEQALRCCCLDLL